MAVPTAILNCEDLREDWVGFVCDNAKDGKDPQGLKGDECHRGCHSVSDMKNADWRKLWG